MPQPASRRLFLKSAVLSGAALAMASAESLAGLPRVGRAPLGPVGPADDPLFRISLAQWSLHRAHHEGHMTALDFAARARSFDIDAIEYVNTFFMDKAGDFAYLRELKQRADDLGVKNLLIMIDAEGYLADADDAARRQAIENHFKWIAAAAFLGCHAIRVNAAGSGTPDEQRDRAADSLRRLAEMATPYGVSVIVENHGGISSNGAWLAEVMRTADHERVGTLPDFGNFRIAEGEHYDRYRGVAELMPFAKAVSAKSHDFDEHGEETSTDYRRMLQLVLDAGYHGYVGIEYEGSRLSEDDGIRATKTLLETVRAEIA